MKNSLFVRNLSPNVNESVIREVFSGCDVIENISFRPWPGNEKQFFAQVDFRTSAGVSEGSKLSGTAILGVICTCGVIDPVTQAEQGKAIAISDMINTVQTEEEIAAQDVEMQAEHLRKAKEAAEELRLRTCHIAGLAEDVQEKSLRKLCEGFGEVEMLKIDKDANGKTFGLVEFKSQKVAHVVKMQKQFLVDDRVLFFTEAKSHVDNARVEEMTVQFQAPIIDAMNMRSVLSQQQALAEKLAKVKAAASEILTKPKEKTDKKEKKDKKKKKDKDKKEKEKKAKKEGEVGDDGKKRKKEKKEKKKDKQEDKDWTEAKRKKEETAQEKDKAEEKEKEVKATAQDETPAAAGEEEEEVWEEEESEEELVDIDEEVEVLPENEIIGMLGESSSSSSSSDYGEDALVEMPVDVAEGKDDDLVSDGEDDVLCDAPPPLVKGKGKGKKGKLILKGKGKGRGPAFFGRGGMRGRGPVLRSPLPLLARSPAASPPPEGGIDLDDDTVHDVEDVSLSQRRKSRANGRPPAEIAVV